mgnify:CR=1 FL=1
MDRTQFAYALGIQALEGAYPKVEIGIYGILDQHGDVGSAQGFGNFLYKEGIRRGARTQPYHIHLMFQTFADMLLVCHLGADAQAILLADPLQPLEPGNSDSLETTGMRAGLPYPGTEHIDTYLLEPAGGLHDLLFAFCAARARHHARTWRKMEKSPVVQGNKFEFTCHQRMILLILFPSAISSRILSSS